LGKTQAMGLLFSLWFVTGINSVAQQSESKADDQPYSLEITPKLHSAGHSLYSGVYLNHHLNLELNATFKYKQMGAFITKYADFVDTHSPINFASVGIFRSIDFNRHLKLTPYVGYFLTQKNSFMDKGSDMWAGLAVKVTINERVWIENTSLVANLLHQAGNPTAMANRLNGALLIGKFRMDSYLWYTHSLDTELHFVGASLALTTPEWILSPSISAKIQVTMLQKLTDEKPEGALDHGVIISLIVPINCTPKIEKQR